MFRRKQTSVQRVLTMRHAMTKTTPRLIITDPLGRQVVPINKPVVSLGRRTESDVRVTGIGVSRHHASRHEPQSLEAIP